MKKRKKHSPSEIIQKLRDAEVAEVQGSTVADIVRRLEISEQTYYRWKKQCKRARCKREIWARSDRVDWGQLPPNPRSLRRHALSDLVGAAADLG